MNKIKTIIALGITALLAGCSGIHVDKEPSLTSLQFSNGKKVYMKTLYVKSDFKENGVKRNFYEYDFTKENSPCTVLREYSPRTYLYTVEKDKQSITFECRPYYDYDMPDERRLYLIGSMKDCQDRTWDYKAQVLNDLSKNTKAMCNYPKRTKANDDTEQLYKEWFKK